MVESLFGPSIGSLVLRLWDHAARHLGYLFQARKKVNEVNVVMEDLKARQNDINEEIQDAERGQKQPTHEVKRWLEKLKENEPKVTQVKTAFTERGCRLPMFRDCSINFCSTYILGRKAAKLHKKLKKLHEERTSFHAITTSLPLYSIPEIPRTSRIVGRGIELNLNAIRGYLQDNAVSVVGIWGMGGVGKTTLLNKVNYSCGDLGFSHVIKVVASKELQLEKLRMDVAESLGMSPHSKEGAIFNFLKDKSFLMFLDELPKDFDLSTIGVPKPCGGGLQSKIRQKLVIATRFEWVCSRMKADKTIKVQCVEPEEAWQLFKENVGEKVIASNPKIRRLAQEITKKCGGLPVALVTIGKAMSNKTVEGWQFTMKSLNKSQTSTIRGMKELFTDLEFSYNNLPNDVDRRCLLSFSLWPEGWKINKEELIMCWLGLGLIDGSDDIDDSYDSGHTLIKNLEEACLLELSANDSNIKIHEVIRGMALWIASDYSEESSKWIPNAGVELREVTEQVADEWREAEKISLMGNQIGAISLMCNCNEVPREHQLHPWFPNLSTLILQQNLALKIIPQGFFGCMPALTYLDLSYCGIKELPSDISRLVMLQYLNSSSTEISSLPNELGHLSRLKHLHLRHTSQLPQVPLRVISRLTNLQVLDLFPNQQVSLEELANLGPGIKALGIGVRSLAALLQLSNVKVWHLSINHLEDSPILHLHLFSNDASRYLRLLEVKQCDMEELVMDVGESIPIFPKLETLELINLLALRGIIWRGVRSDECFPRLQHVMISMCHNLKNVSWVQHLPFLIELNLNDCEGMEQVIGDAENEITGGAEVSEIQTEGETNLILPCLREVRLDRLPKLQNIYNHAINLPSLKNVVVFNCPELKKLPFQSEVANNCQFRIWGDQEWWDGITWEPESTKTSLLPCFKVASCHEDVLF